MNMLIVGILVNTLLFGYAGFTNKKTGIPHKLPKFLLNPIIERVFTFGYLGSFVIILLAPGGLLRNIIISLLMQFVINHILWGSIVGSIAGALNRKKLDNIIGNIANKSNKRNHK